MKTRLSVKIYASYVLIILIGAATAFVTTKILAPHLFNRQVSMMNNLNGGMIGKGSMAQGESLRIAYANSLNSALITSMLVALAIATILAIFVTKRIVRPLELVSQATKKIAAGDYDAHVPLPDEREIAAIASDVNSLATSLSQTENRRTRLLGDVAHEMRTPLTILDGYLEGLIDNVFQPSPETFETMSVELHRLHRLSDDLSNVSRAEELRFDLKMEKVEVVTLISNICTRLKPQFIDAGITLKYGSKESIILEVDSQRITQVITNLLGNALVATDEDGTVNVSVEKMSDFVQIKIADSGIGIPADQLESIFERFYRIPTATKTSQGSGVGLTISREIARAHGGTLRAYSGGLKKGSIFILQLPIEKLNSNTKS